MKILLKEEILGILLGGYILTLCDSICYVRNKHNAQVKTTQSPSKHVCVKQASLGGWFSNMGLHLLWAMHIMFLTKHCAA